MIRLTASAAAAYTGSLQLTDGHLPRASVARGLMFAGALSNGELYEAQMQGAKPAAPSPTAAVSLISATATA